jgi:hypothetical protein
LFLANVLAPALASAFKTAVTNFQLGAAPAGQDQGLVLNQAFDLPPAHAAGETYTPVVGSLVAHVKDTQISLALAGSCSMGMDINMTFQASSVIGASFSAATRTFTFTTVGTPTFNHQQYIPWYDHLLDVFAAVAEVILQVCVAAIGGELGNSIAKMSGASDISTYAPDVVGWTGGNGFSPDQGGLATCLFMRGALV